jgi:O-antigen/teichoic acid export membrane protein
MSEAAQATRGSGIRLAAELGSRLFAVATSFLLAAGLGVSAFGLFAAVSSMAVIAAELAELGLQQTAARALVAGTLRLRDMVRARLLLSGALVLFTLAVPFLLAAASSLGRSAPGEWASLLPPLILYFGVSGWSEFLGVALRARGHRLAEAVVLLALRAFTLAAVAAALAARASLAGLAWAHVGAATAALLVSAALIRRASAAPAEEAPALAPGHGVRAVLRTSLPLAVNGALALVSLRVELLVVFWAQGSWAAGLFGAAVKIVESLNGVPAAIAAGAMPALTREAMQRDRAGDPATHGAARSRTAATVALLAVPAAAGLFLLAPGVVQLLGADYAGAAPALRLLALAVVALFMNCVLLHALIASGHASWLPWLTAVRVGFAALAAAALVPRFGVAGAAAGFLGAELLLLVLSSRACRRSGFAVPLFSPLGVGLLATVPMAATVAALGAGTLASVAAGAAVYAATLAGAWVLMRQPLLRLLGTEAA